MKYIVLKRKKMGCDQLIPIIFPNEINHSDVSSALLSCKEYGFDKQPVSAGFCSSLDLGVFTDQKSETLGIGPADDDSKMMRNHDYLHGL